MTRLKKVPGVRDLYRDAHSQLYYVRSQQGGINAYISLNTTRKEQAIKNMEELRGNQFRRRHEIPEEEEAGPSPLLGGALRPISRGWIPEHEAETSRQGFELFPRPGGLLHHAQKVLCPEVRKRAEASAA